VCFYLFLLTEYYFWVCYLAAVFQQYWVYQVRKVRLQVLHPLSYHFCLTSLFLLVSDNVLLLYKIVFTQLMWPIWYRAIMLLARNSSILLAFHLQPSLVVCLHLDNSLILAPEPLYLFDEAPHIMSQVLNASDMFLVALTLYFGD
jgi:hypothetical protein